MTKKLLALILDSLAKVENRSFAGFSIKIFVNSAHLKSDREVISMIQGLQSQIIDNPNAMMSVLGDQYEFIRTIRFNEGLQSSKSVSPSAVSTVDSFKNNLNIQYGF